MNLIDRINRIEQLEAELEREKEKNRWISVEDRLPEKRGYYFVYRPNAKSENAKTAKVYFNENNFTFTRRFTQYKPVTHWMPLPDPPIKEIDK